MTLASPETQPFVGMDDVELLTIGRFARISGLSIHALRHYDDVGLLIPAAVDARSGYRRYRRDQVALARLIRSLRCTDLPIEDVRVVARDPSADAARNVLDAHRSRLERKRSRLGAQLGDVNHFIEKGIAMPTSETTCRPVQLKIAVDDVVSARTFYEQAFGLRYQVIRRTEGADYSDFAIGRAGDDSFFLLHLCEEGTEVDRPGQTTFGMLVDDLDAVHARAVAAGGTEVVAARSLEGMPRSSAVRDPSGNWVWLYQA